MDTPANIDQYIKNLPEEIQEILQQLRATLKKAAPDAKETISYGIHTLILNGNLVHFGGYKKHIGFYPAPSAIKAFKDELSGYVSGKGTIQFPLDRPLPFDLITQIVQFRIKENLQKAEVKAKKKPPVVGTAKPV